MKDHENLALYCNFSFIKSTFISYKMKAPPLLRKLQSGAQSSILDSDPKRFLLFAQTKRKLSAFSRRPISKDKLSSLIKTPKSNFFIIKGMSSS